MTVHRKIFLIIKPTDALISQIYFFKDSTCFGQFLCPSSGVFHCTFGTGICHAGLMTAFKHDLDGRAWKPSSNLRLLVLL